MKFSKEHSLIVKGVLIIFMLTHHLFLNTAVYESKQLITLIHNLDNWENYVIFFKICVSGFVFISAYGIAEQISGLYSRDVETSSKKMLGYAIGRWQHLWFSFVFIYILAILYTRFFTSSSITRLYSNEDGFSLGYILIDMLGLADWFSTPTLNVTWWYMPLAIFLIFLVPIFYIIYKKAGFLAIPFLLLLVGGMYGGNYLRVALWGIICQNEKIFERLHAAGGTKPKTLVIKFCICILAIVLLGSTTIHTGLWIRISGIWTFLIVYFCYEFITRIFLLREILKFFGKHSMNIFLIHTFIYYYWYQDFIYAFKWDVLIVVMLLFISLISSVAIEKVKEILKYPECVKSMITGCAKILENKEKQC